ncbi:hypothetical protein [Halomonas campaniensis]|uniref:hypothetical protein n=1 Tax=Halomonas campaniensis TaxID=213554 RepID=UPI000B52C856|nr:hypothetical protein [Halomonas campaniensis]
MSLKASQREIKRDQLVLDSTPFGKKLKERFFDPGPYRVFLFCITAASLLLPILLPVWLIILWMCTMLRSERSFRLPLRIPKDLKIRDPSDYQEIMKEESLWFGLVKRSKIVKKVAFGSGILYLGFLRSADRSKRGQELWLTNSDARTHLFLAGTTGSGKTETNLGIYANSLCWGSGTVYADGKGDSSLPFSMWSMARKFGREDDFLLLNFLTGGEDPLERFIRIEKGLEVDLPQSNNQNPYAYGSADFLFNLTSSLLPETSGDSAVWQDKALNLISALTQVFCYKRAQGGFQISIGQYRHYLALDNLVKLYKESLEPGAPEIAYQPIKSYFETGLPGFNPALVDRPEDWDPEVRNQHGYLTGQFSRVLSMMMDTYGYIFDTQSPEIDPEDVLLNNRILCILVPSLEKSPSEAGALGKLTVNSVRLMMARNLGFQVEGSENDVLNIKQTNSPYPSIIIWDELAYYFAEGIAVMYAQARSLGFMMVASVQDVQKLMDAGDKGEIGALIANTKVKWTLALEDAAETFDIFNKAADEGFYSVLSGHDRETGIIGGSSWKNQSSTRVEKQARLRIDELKNLSPGQGVVIFQDQVVRCSSFYIPDEDKRAREVEVKLNRFLPIEPPSIEKAPECLRLPKDYMSETTGVIRHLQKGLPAAFPHLNDPILDRLIEVANRVEQLKESSIDVDPKLIGPILFEAAAEAMKECDSQEDGSWMPKERTLDDEEFFDDEL